MTRPALAPGRAITIALVWALTLAVFAAQWYAYDATRASAEPFRFYLGWSAYMWALLTPCGLWLAWRFPITARTWRSRVLLHLGASIALTGVQLSLEAYLGWLRHGRELSVQHAFRHYFSQHSQISLIAYWLLVAATMLYKARREAHESTVRSAVLQTQLGAARLAVLRNQLQPHFLFNTLQAVTTLVRDDPDRAEDILVRLSDLLRASFEEPDVQEIPLSRELEILDHYLAIQACRFQDRLRFEIDVDPAVRTCLVPGMLLQPVVENAVGHGIGIHRESDVVTIRATRVDTHLRIEVSNRTSVLPGVNGARPRRGLGLAATRERLLQLYGANASGIELHNLVPTGVSAEIWMPIRPGPQSADTEPDVPVWQSAS